MPYLQYCEKSSWGLATLTRVSAALSRKGPKITNLKTTGYSFTDYLSYGHVPEVDRPWQQQLERSPHCCQLDSPVSQGKKVKNTDIHQCHIKLIFFLCIHLNQR